MVIGEADNSARHYHDSEVHAAAIGALLTGQQVAEVAKTFNLSVSTVRAWKQSMGDENSRTFDATQRVEIGDLLVEDVRTLLHALRIQVECFSDPEWLATQNAADAAVLHGIIVDKMIRILEAIDTDNEASAA